MNRKYPDVDFNKHINILGRLSRSETIERMKHAEIGLLINSNTNPHSVKYTSPLKYFEYLGAGLKVLAVDFDSHRRLPFSDNITFFNNNDFLSFEESLNKANDSKKDISINKDLISLQNRVVKILKLAVI